MRVAIKNIHIENFKGIKDLNVKFGETTSIYGKNGSGKTTIVDAVMWTLFNKNSQYVEKFDIRPLDSDGKQVDFVDIVVALTLDVDGKEFELKKTQKQNWVKKHGTEHPTFQGNVNSYEIDGYPRSEKDYKAFISEMVSEDVFKMVTNPTYFPNIKWKEQREILMQFASKESDVELAKRLGGFELLIPELEKAPSTDDIAKKFAKTKKELNDKLTELPIRIDEVSKTKVADNSAELLVKKEELSGRIVMIDHEELQKLKEKAMQIQFDISKRSQEIENESKNNTAGLRNKIAELKSRRNDITVSDSNVRSKKRIEEFSLNTAKGSVDGLKKQLSSVDDYKFDESKYVFDENSSVCQTCGQMLPASKVEQIKSDLAEKHDKDKAYFDEQIASKKQLLTNEIKVSEMKIAELEEKISSYNAELNVFNAENDALSLEIAKLTSELNNVPTVCVEDDEVIIGLRNALANVNSGIASIDVKNRTIEFENSRIESEILNIDLDLMRIKSNADVDARIEELKNEQLDIAQRYSDCEQMLYLLENFIKAKLDAVSQEINSRFKTVNFKLFDVAINGGVTETCECTVNGVPYASLNSAAKIQAGLDIINTLSEVYNCYAFICIDNRESCTNIPKMSTQVINLYVYDSCESLLVESV